MEFQLTAEFSLWHHWLVLCFYTKACSIQMIKCSLISTVFCCTDPVSPCLEMGHKVTINRYSELLVEISMGVGVYVCVALFMCYVKVSEAIDEGVSSTLPPYSSTQGSNTIEESLHFTSWLHHSLMTLSHPSPSRHSSPMAPTAHLHCCP